MKHCSLILILLLVLFISCGPSKFEQEVYSRMIYAECNFYYDEFDTTLIDSILVYDISTERDKNLFVLLQNRYTPLSKINDKRLEAAADYFKQKGDSAYCAMAYARLGDLAYYSQDRLMAVSYYKKAEILCPDSVLCLYARIKYSLSNVYYHTVNVEHKRGLLHEALKVYEQKENGKFMSLCYTDLMTIARESDSIQYYANKVFGLIEDNKIDSLELLRFYAAYVKRSVNSMSGDSILLLIKPVYEHFPTPENAIMMSMGYIQIGDTINAEPYINFVRRCHDKGVNNNYYFEYMKAIYNKDYKRAAEECFNLMDVTSLSMYDSYVKNFIQMEKQVEINEDVLNVDKERTHMERMIYILIIFILLISLISLFLYMYMNLKNRELSIKHDNVKTRATEVIKENLMTIPYNVHTEHQIIDRIDTLTGGLSVKLRKEYPILKNKDIIMMFMKYIGCSSADIANYFGYTVISTIHHRFSVLKKSIGTDKAFDVWIVETIDRLTPDLSSK